MRMGFLPVLKFEANHPFLFVFKENNNGVILFIGRFSRP
jgi:serine protease inhibitor